jgi:hypothetical protein
MPRVGSGADFSALRALNQRKPIGPPREKPAKPLVLLGYRSHRGCLSWYNCVPQRDTPFDKPWREECDRFWYRRPTCTSGYLSYGTRASKLIRAPLAPQLSSLRGCCCIRALRCSDEHCCRSFSEDSASFAACHLLSSIFVLHEFPA